MITLDFMLAEFFDIAVQQNWASQVLASFALFFYCSLDKTNRGKHWFLCPNLFHAARSLKRAPIAATSVLYNINPSTVLISLSINLHFLYLNADPAHCCLCCVAKCSFGVLLLLLFPNILHSHCSQPNFTQ